MIKEALAYILQLKKDPVITENGIKYNCRADNSLIPLSEIDKIKLPEVEPIETQTLTSIIDYLQQNPDGLGRQKLYIVVANHQKVYLESSLFGDFRQKETYMVSAFREPKRNLNYQSLEEFLVMLNSTFKESPDLKTIVKILSKVVENNVKETVDDGFSQTVMIKDGVDLVKESKLPRLVSLIPFRTFPEAEQPMSDFLLRARKGHDGLQYSLFEADGGAWQNQAIQNIKMWLQDQLDIIKLEIPILA